MGISWSSPETIVNYKPVSSESDNTYDLILYGAYSFTGKIATQYIFSQYFNTIKVAISGSDIKKLQQLNNMYDNKFHILLCNSDNSNESQDLIHRLNSHGCILNLANPYNKRSCGSNLIKACVDHKRNYCDVYGDPNWCRQNISKFHDQAKLAGVRIVQFCAYDSLFFSIVVQKIAQHMKKTYDEELETIELYDEIKCKPSKCSITSAMQIRKNNNKTVLSSIDPLIYDGDDTYNTKHNNVTCFTSSTNNKNKSNLASYILPLPGANINYSCVKRDNVFLKYGKDLNYKEGLCFHSIFDVIAFYFHQFWTCLLIYTGLYRDPTKQEMIDSYLDVVGVGRSKSHEIAACFSVNKDPGYIHSATSCVEVAMSLIVDRDKLNNHTGVITATMLNDGSGNGVVLDRLLKHPDFEFEVLYEKCLNSEETQNIVSSLPSGQQLIQNNEHAEMQQAVPQTTPPGETDPVGVENLHPSVVDESHTDTNDFVDKKNN